MSKAEHRDTQGTCSRDALDANSKRKFGLQGGADAGMNGVAH